MNKLSIFARNVKNEIVKHGPEISTGVGIALGVTTTILAVKATPRAVQLLEERKQEDGVEKLTPVETVKTAWKCYIPAIATGALSITCLIIASTTNKKRQAALAAAYALSETTLKEYRDKVVETVGEEKEKEVREAIAQDRINQEPVHDIPITNSEDCLCYELLTGRYFRSNETKLKKALNDLNYQLLNHDNVSLNEFFDLIGVPHADIGYDLGWRIDVHGMVQLDIYSKIADDGTACLVLDYMTRPTYDFNKWL